jgi:photosystem II stability/assembly factor-like uncharacterized protein
MRSLRTLAAAALLLTTTSPSSANGRFPESLRLVEDPRTADRLYVAGTFGLLSTEDRGKNWYYTCEKSFAFAFLEGDPLLEVTNDGTMLSGIIESLNRSRDCGCTWQSSLGESATENVIDITLDPSAANTVLALSQKNDVLPFRAELRETTDSGASWSKIADLPSGSLVFTLDVAPSEPRRVYATALARAAGGPDAGPDRGVLYVTKDRGATWETRGIPGTSSGVQPFIAGVHPTAPDTVFVRTDEWIDNGEPAANDMLLVTTDAGQTWKEVIRKGAKLFGFALSPDGGTVLVGYGDPLQAGGRSTEPADLGLYKASTKDYVFEKIFPGMVSCLRWTSNGLYVCNTENNPDAKPNDFELGFAKNADFTLGTPDPLSVLLRLKDVRGPGACHAADCSEIWANGLSGAPAVCEQFRASCTAPASPGRLSCGGGSGGAEAGVGPDAMTGGSGGSGGATTGGPGASGGAGSGDGDGCGCKVMGGRFESAPPLALLAMGALFGLRLGCARKGKPKS